MISKEQREFVHQSVGEKTERCLLINETACSWLWLISGQSKYILKINKKNNIKEEYENHKTIYDLWSQNESGLDFQIPKPYAIGNNYQEYIMDYVEEGQNLLEILFRNDHRADNIFLRTGQCLCQFHELTTRGLINAKQDLLLHNSIAKILKKKKGKKLKKLLGEFSNNTNKVIFKDFKPSNVVVDKNNKIYFLDFQKIYYYAPFYYDLARFIDTTKIFAIVKKPLFSLSNRRYINSAIQSFLIGYGDGIVLGDLKKMQKLHRSEHICMKRNINIFDSIVLKFLYWLV
jgi:hypothetical protein